MFYFFPKLFSYIYFPFDTHKFIDDDLLVFGVSGLKGSYESQQFLTSHLRGHSTRSQPSRQCLLSESFRRSEGGTECVRGLCPNLILMSSLCICSVFCVKIKIRLWNVNVDKMLTSCSLDCRARLCLILWMSTKMFVYTTISLLCAWLCQCGTVWTGGETVADWPALYTLQVQQTLLTLLTLLPTVTPQHTPPF